MEMVVLEAVPPVLAPSRSLCPMALLCFKASQPVCLLSFCLAFLCLLFPKYWLVPTMHQALVVKDESGRGDSRASWAQLLLALLPGSCCGWFCRASVEEEQLAGEAGF